MNCDKSSPTIAAIWALFVAKAFLFIASRCTCIVHVVIHRAQYRHKGTFLPGPKMLHHMEFLGDIQHDVRALQRVKEDVEQKLVF